MARQHSDREDLMAEAVTLAPRIQFTIAGSECDIMAGQRADGRWSIFFGGDPVYQFDARHQLRRAFVNGHLFRTQGSTLARLTRQESPGQTVLARHDLTVAELETFFQQMRGDLLAIVDAGRSGNIELIQVIPVTADFLPTLISNINHVLTTDNLLAPAISRR